MCTFIIVIVRIVVIASLLWLPLPAPRSSAQAQRHIVVLHSHVSPEMVDTLVARYSLTLRHVYLHAFNGFSADVPLATLAQLRTDPLVAQVELNTSGELAGEVAATTSSTQRKRSQQVIPDGIRRIGADRSPIARIDGVDVALDVDIAVIDSGIQADHPDLNVYGSIVCADGAASEQPSVDVSGHGTAVAGVIAAKDNDLGVVGVAPGARLWSVRVGHRAPDNRVRYNTDDLICAVDWLTAHADVIEVANISLGAYNGMGFQHGRCGQAGTTAEASLHRAICTAVAAGVTIVVAAGEPRPNMPRTDAAMIAPAAFDEVITVSAMADFDGQDQGKARKRPCSAADDDDTFWDESNYGSAVDFAAPGVCIATTSQALWSGTSFAAPYVAGAAALYKIVHPSATPSQVKRALQAAAEYDWNVYATANASSGDDPDGRPEPLINVLNLKAIPKQQRTIQRNPISFPIDSVRYVSSITPRYPRSLLR